ncbi:hypothetical protein niasHT_017980 [Heterodera trifolii]|uniref:Glutathione synthetase n=1 Tax=Heterodera trifolii TaxID=157864 RepID=A0ABD2LBJ6_9BILA
MAFCSYPKYLLVILLWQLIYVVISNPTTEELLSKNEEINEDGNAEDLRMLVEEAIDMAQNLSMTISPKALVGRGDTAEIVPFSLFPSPFPRKLFEQAKEVQMDFNLLYFRISNDYKFLVETYEELAKTNDQIRMHLQILKKTHEEGIKQTKSIMLARSDYMCHEATNNDETTPNEPQYGLKQVEFNAGQIGGTSVSSRLYQIHRHTVKIAGLSVPDDNLPEGAGDTGIAEVLMKAWYAFGDPKGIILFITHRRNRNRFAQRHIEYELRRLTKNKAETVRIGYPECTEMMKNGRLTLNDNFKLRFDDRTVAIVYFVTDFFKPSEDDWEMRLMVERSTAIKSPTSGLQLASMKKMQQVLAQPGMVERFLPENPKKAVAIRATFAGLWRLTDQDDEAVEATKDAIVNPSNYVLKPSKEGGGNNIWDDEIADKLLNFTPEERSAHILMQKLQPLFFENYMVQPHRDDPLFGKMSTELSIFGFLFGDSKDNRVLYNKQNGHFMRTKLAGENEGGVVHGTAVFDSPFLF